jgi:hypothetical protein
MADLTHDRLLYLVDYNPLTGVFVNKVSRRKSRAGQVAGTSHNGGYRLIKVDRKNYLAHRLAWFYVHGKWPDHQIDHINGDKKDNRIANLRQATCSENMQNIRLAQKRSKSGVRGVSWVASRSRWVAQISVGGKQKNLGRFDDIEAAINAYQQARTIFHPYAPKGV